MASPTADRPSPRALVILLALSVASALLALWQWMELLVVRGGGQATCTFSSSVDCSPVWSSTFAARIHDFAGLPLAGLGLEWGLTGFALSCWLVYRTVGNDETRALETAVKVWAAIGFLSCITFAVASARIGVLCPSCLLTYALTAAFAGAAFGALPAPVFPEATTLVSALPRALLIAIPLHLALLYPGQRTPKSTSTALAKSLTDDQVMDYFARLTPPEKAATTDARKKWLESKVPDYTPPAAALRWGPADAPVKIVEFTDVLCGHCRALVAMLAELKRVVPPGRVSIEPRYFPLDGECNPFGGAPKGDGVRCLGAKLLICLESRPEYWDVHEKVFENQPSLDKEKLWSLATEKGVERAVLEACIADPKTTQRLVDDIKWAMAYKIEGTPLVLINGRETFPVGPFIFGMTMSGGDAESKFFAKLPP